MSSPRDALTIERLNGRFRSPVPLDAARCDAWLDALRDADGEALTAGLVEPDAWLLLRRLPLALRWRADSSLADVRTQWQVALREALVLAVDHPVQSEAVYYRRRYLALADLLYRSAQGDSTRQWAWRRMDLLPGAGLTPVEALGHGLGHLLAEPELIWPVLQRLVAGEAATASLTALLGTIGVGDWRRLLAASPRTAGFVALVLGEVAPGAIELAGVQAGAGQRTASPPSGEPNGPVVDAITAPPLPSAATELLQWLMRRPHLSSDVQRVVVVLAAALTASASTLGFVARQRLIATLIARLDTAIDTTATSPQAGTQARAEVRPPPTRADDLLPLPALEDTERRLPTAWGGALFWLGRLNTELLLDWQAGQDDLPLTSLLRTLGEGLGIPDDDPALLAFCGGDLAPALPEGPRFDAARLGIDAQLARWSAWLDEQAPDLAPPRLEAVCQRTGELRLEPGWIELHLPLGSVDTSVRRLGLDLDPGWLPWLGCVLRIIYDDDA